MARHQAQTREVQLTNPVTELSNGTTTRTSAMTAPLHPEHEGRRFARGALVGLAICLPVWAGIVAIILQLR